MLSLGLLAPLVSCGDRNETTRPNIILFLVDDYGWSDSANDYGDKPYPKPIEIHTPNMERLARAGVVMTSAYACPVSSPTRTSLMTGMHAAHEHITNYLAPKQDMPTDCMAGHLDYSASLTGVQPSGLERGEWNWNGICPEGQGSDTLAHVLRATMLPQILQDAGYFTIHVGKAHFAPYGTPAASPCNMGFIVNVAGNCVGLPGSYLSEDHYGNTPEKWSYEAVQDMTQYYETGTHLTEALTREALRTMDYPVSKGQPFFLYMSHFAVHTPIQADMRYYRKYRDAGYDEGQSRYASMVEGVDTSLGEILDYVERKGIADNTVIIFYSDNGGHSIDNRKGGVVHTQNAPLREGKGSCYEGGVRVPMMFRWKGRSAEGVRVNTPVNAEDIFPTILDFAGAADARTVQPLDGESLVRLFVDGSQYVAAQGRFETAAEANRFVVPQSVSGVDPQRPIISHYPHQWRRVIYDDIDYLSSIRRGDWKLVYRMKTGALELYDLAEDIAERHDLAAENPQIVERLARELSDRLRAWKATMPRYAADGRAVPMPDEAIKPEVRR